MESRALTTPITSNPIVWHEVYSIYSPALDARCIYKLHINITPSHFSIVAPDIVNILQAAILAGTIDGFKFANKAYFNDGIKRCEQWLEDQKHNSKSSATAIAEIKGVLQSYKRHSNLSFAIYLHNNTYTLRLPQIAQLCLKIDLLLKRLNITAGDITTHCTASDLPLPSKYFILRQDRLSPQGKYVSAFDAENTEMGAIAKKSKFYSDLTQEFKSCSVSDAKAIVAKTQYDVTGIEVLSTRQTKIMTGSYRLSILINIDEERAIPALIREISLLLNIAVINGDIHQFNTYDINVIKQDIVRLKAQKALPDELLDYQRRMHIPFEILLADQFKENNFDSLVKLMRSIYWLIQKQNNLDVTTDLCVSDRILPGTPFALRKCYSEKGMFVAPFSPQNKAVINESASHILFSFLQYKWESTQHLVSGNPATTFKPTHPQATTAAAPSTTNALQNPTTKPL